MEARGLQHPGGAQPNTEPATRTKCTKGQLTPELHKDRLHEVKHTPRGKVVPRDSYNVDQIFKKKVTE